MITSDVFHRYEYVRERGFTNMFDVDTVCLMACITRDQCFEIMKHYSQYNNEYNKETTND